MSRPPRAAPPRRALGSSPTLGSVSLVAALSVTSAAPSVWAQGAPVAQSTTAPSPADVAKAKALFDAGGRAYDTGDFETAIQAFEQAYKLVRREGLLFSLAQAHRRQFAVSSRREHLDRAIELYRQYLSEVRSGGRRVEAAKALGELEAAAQRLPAVDSAPEGEVPLAPERVDATRITLSTSTPDAQISVDGSEARPSPLSVQVEPGPHRVVVRAKGYRDKELVVLALEGELVPVNDILLEEIPARLDVVTTTGASISVDGRFVGEAPLARPLELASGRRFVSVTRSGRSSRSIVVELSRGETRSLDLELSTTTQRDFAWGGAIGSGVLLAGGAALGTLAFVRQSQARDLYALGPNEGRGRSIEEAKEYLSLRSERDRLLAGAGTLSALGAVVGLVSVGLFAFDEPAPVLLPDEPEPNAPRPAPSPERPALELGFAPSFGPDAAQLGLVGRF